MAVWDRGTDKTGLRPAYVSVLVLVLVSVLYFWSCFQTVMHYKTLCDTIMLKCNMHLCSFMQ